MRPITVIREEGKHTFRVERCESMTQWLAVYAVNGKTVRTVPEDTKADAARRLIGIAFRAGRGEPQHW